MGITAGSSPTGRAVRPRNRRGEGARLRADILAAATDLLDRGDERAVTLRAVARKAGIAARSIYPHFPDRPAIMLAVVREAFGELSGRLRAAADAAGDGPRQTLYATGDPRQQQDTVGDDLRQGLYLAADDHRQRLYAACHAYLDFAAVHPERYRVMFGGVWNPVLTNGGATAVAIADVPAFPGAGVLRILADILADCVAADCSTSTDPFADAVALWLALHGFAHQRAVTHTFPWPADLARRFVSPLSRMAPVRPRTFPNSTVTHVS
ncbi:TetR/AcrR family transcriptional regulator [Streptomyces sp. NPDC088341]|uniref:TetR/AcrR family transcriptional regulator n=1 Tax=Streptomyces sp. NPDC088341 TaxID=3154870 RepID=UPI0034185629